MEAKDKNHYCNMCVYADKPMLGSPCYRCEYNEDKGFSEWKAVMTIHDVIHKPKHYILVNNLEVRDVLAALVAKMTSENIPGNALFESDYVQMMQYLMRFMDKNGKQDLEKARWYLDKLIDAYA